MLPILLPGKVGGIYSGVFRPFNDSDASIHILYSVKHLCQQLQHPVFLGIKPQLGCKAGFSRMVNSGFWLGCVNTFTDLSPESNLDCLGCVLTVIVLLEGAHSVQNILLQNRWCDCKSIIALWPRMSWYQVLMDKLCLAQMSKNEGHHPAPFTGTYEWVSVLLVSGSAFFKPMLCSSAGENTNFG